jgi:hypothetical protein
MVVSHWQGSLGYGHCKGVPLSPSYSQFAAYSSLTLAHLCTATSTWEPTSGSCSKLVKQSPVRSNEAPGDKLGGNML